MKIKTRPATRASGIVVETSRPTGQQLEAIDRNLCAKCIIETTLNRKDRGGKRRGFWIHEADSCYFQRKQE